MTRERCSKCVHRIHGIDPCRDVSVMDPCGCIDDSLAVIYLALTKPPLSLNDRMHWARKAKLVKNVRTHVAGRAHNLLGFQSATVTLHYRPRDKDNLFATLKPCIDGLVDAGVLPADHGEHVEPRVKLHDPVKGEPGALWLTVEPRALP